MMNEKGRFIVVEGIDRSGKSTLSRGVTDLLRKLGYNAILTSEPTPDFDSKFSSLYKEEPSPENEFSILTSLFLRDRQIHNSFIKEQLSEGKIVICDRYSLSTFAYQGVFFRKFFRDDESFFQWMSTFMKMFHMDPDLTVFIDFNSKMFASRKSGEKRYSLFEKEQYLSEVYKIYRICVDRNALSSKYLIIPGDLDPESMRKKAMESILDLLRQ
jgi:dTMP kinase